MEKVAVVIPVYKRNVSIDEETSLSQCFKVLNNYPIILVCPIGLDISSYLEIAKIRNKELIIEEFPIYYFEGISGYNKLLLSLSFYNRLVNYRFVLIHQTDTFIFRDELSYWCNLDYDYIGSPWLMDIAEWLTIPKVYPYEIRLFYKVFGKHKMSKTGNGGLSLRKTRSFINNLSIFRWWANRWTSNEDNFFSHCINILNPFFKIPSLDVSLRFGFDAMPEKAFEMNNFKLPFGCHGWCRGDSHYISAKEFWRQFIK